jgi:hypothetical protein
MESLEFALWKRRKHKELGRKKGGPEGPNEDIESMLLEKKPLEIEARLEKLETKLGLVLESLKTSVAKIEEDNMSSGTLSKLEALSKSVNELTARLDAGSTTKPSSADSGELGTRISLTKRLQEVLDIVKAENKTTPTSLAQKLNCSTATSCEFLKKLTKLGKLKRVKRGVYQPNEPN